MFGNNHYIRVDSNNSVIHAFSDAFEVPQTTDICISEDDVRHYNPNLFEGDGIALYKWDGKEMIERTIDEIAADKAKSLPSPPSTEDRLKAAEDAITALMGV